MPVVRDMKALEDMARFWFEICFKVMRVSGLEIQYCGRNGFLYLGGQFILDVRVFLELDICHAAL